MPELRLHRPFIWQYYLLFWILGSISTVWPVPALLCAICLCLAVRRWTIPAISLATLLLIGAYICVNLLFPDMYPRGENLPDWARNEENIFHGRFCGHIQTVRGVQDNGLRILLSDLKPENMPAADPLPGLCMWSVANPPETFNPLPGQRVCLTATFKLAMRSINFAEDYRQTSRLASGAVWQTYSLGERGNPRFTGTPSEFATLREKARKRFIQVLQNKNTSGTHGKNDTRLSQGDAILLALLFGDRRFLSTETVNNFASATLAHSLALSGQHLSVVALAGFLLIFVTAVIFPRIYLFKPRMHLTALVSVPLALLYLWLGNAPPSLMRASSMLFLFTFLVWRYTAFSGLDLLAGALSLILALNPMIIFDTGLQLSALCVALILLFMPAIDHVCGLLLPPPHSRLKKLLWRASQILLVSFVIQVFLLPLNLARFSMLGLWFPLNLVWLPLLGLVVLPFAALGLVCSLIPCELFTFPAQLFLAIAVLPCDGILYVLDFMRHYHILDEPVFMRPHGLYVCSFAILAVALAWQWGDAHNKTVKNRINLFILVALIFMLVPPTMRLMQYFHPTVRVETLDVGQGLSMYISLPGNIRLLYDGGGSPATKFDIGKNIVAPYISHNAFPRLDAIFNSHPDMDHLGGLFYLMDKFTPKNIFHNGHEAAGETGKKWLAWQNSENSRILFAGDVIYLGDPKNDLRLEILHPPASAIPFQDGSRAPDLYWSGNNASIVMRLCQGDEGLVLFTGDVETEALANLVNKGSDITAKVVIAPHHGSNKSLLPAFYKKARPQLVIAACGFQNRWDFPGTKLVSFLARHNIPVFDTASAGRITLEFDKNGKFTIQSVTGKRDKTSWTILPVHGQSAIFTRTENLS